MTDRPTGRASARAERLTRWAQLAYPPPLRDRYGAEMAQTVRDRLAEPDMLAGRPRRRVLVRMLGDVVVAGLRLRLQRLGLLAGPLGDPPRRSPHKTIWSLDMIFQDLRYAFRALRTSPSFTLVAVLLLALGIGANSAIFSLVSTYLLKPYPYPDPDSLVTIHTSSEKYGFGYGQFSLPDYVDLRAQAVGLVDVALWQTRSYNVASGDSAVRVPGAHVTANFFDVLGVEMLLGRTFVTGEDQPGNMVVILSEGAWRNDFGADPNLVGGEILLDGVGHTVIGVLRAGSELPDSRKLWKAHTEVVDEEPRYRRINRVIGRLAPGSTLAAVREELAAFGSRLAETYPDSNGAFSMTAQSLRDYRVGDTVPLLRMLMGVVFLVLLIVCANLANLLLARTNRRHHELAVRVALGAGRARIVRQLLLEGVLLSLAGGGLGILGGQYALGALMRTRPVPLPAWYDVSIDGRVLLFALATTVTSVLLFGLLPAIRASRPDLQEALNAVARAGGGGRGRLLGSLVVAEVALSTILLVGAVLAVRSFLNVLGVAPGFNPESTVTLSVRPADNSYTAWESVAFVQALEGQVAALPGVRQVGSAAVLPLIGTASTLVQADNQTDLDAKDNPSMQFYPVTPDFFEAMQIPLLSGRAFTIADDRESEAIVIVSASTAARFWPGEAAVGKQLRQTDSRWMRVVGVVGDVRQAGLDERVELQMYLPHAQEPWRGMALVIRADGDPSAQIAAVREEIRRLDPTIAPYNIITMADAVELVTFQRRFLALLVWIFGGLSVLLAAIGLYGVVSYSASQRTREIGLRMALGATHRDVLRLIATQGMGLTLIGLALGLVGALLLSQTISNQLFEVNATDPLVYAAVALGLGAVALLAALIPGQRAARLDPAIALRDD